MENLQSGILLVCGIPGSGKTYLTNKISQSIGKKRILRINFDKVEKWCRNLPYLVDNSSQITKIGLPILERSIIHELDLLSSLDGKKIDDSEEFKPEAWKISRKLCYDMVKNFLELFSQGSEDPFIIILDDNFLLKSMRKPYYILSWEYKTGFCELHIQADLNTSLYRNGNRPSQDRIPEDIIIDSYNKFEDFLAKEHGLIFDNNSIEDEDNNTTTKLNDLCYKIAKIFAINVKYNDENLTLEQRKEHAEINKKNFIHQLDLRIRTIVNLYAQANSQELRRISQDRIPLLELTKFFEMTNIRSKLSFLSQLKSLFLEIVSFIYSKKIEETTLSKSTKKREDLQIQLNKSQKAIAKEVKEKEFSYLEFCDQIISKLENIEWKVDNLDSFLQSFSSEFAIFSFDLLNSSV
jgi:Predicted nucleotide kinase